MKARGTGPMRSTPRSPARQRRNGILLWIPCVRNQTFLREQIAYQRRKMDQQAPHFCTMRVQSDSFSFSLHGTVVLVGAVLVLCGCQAPDPYAPFNKAPIDMETSPSTSWEGVRDHTTLPTAGSTEKWPGPLVRDILQLGPWPPASPQQRAAIDSAWQQFTAFEGTRIAVSGIDSVLQREGAITQGAQDITDALSRFHQHFPAAPIPHVDM